MHCVLLISSPPSAAATSACVGSHTAPDRGEPDQPHHVSLTATDGSGGGGGGGGGGGVALTVDKLFI